MELNKNLIVAMLATGISANTFAANDSNNPEAGRHAATRSSLARLW